MIKQLTKRPFLSAILAVAGIGLFTAGIVFFPIGGQERALAAACDSSYVSLNPSPGKYASRWKVSKWLEFDKNAPIPFGPAQWRVVGKINNQGASTCYSEKWSVSKLVNATTKRSDRGAIANVYVNDNSITCAACKDASDFNLALVDPNVQGSSLDSGGRDLTFAERAGTLTQGGLYGLLANTGIADSRAWYPTEWVVEGSF